MCNYQIKARHDSSKDLKKTLHDGARQVWALFCCIYSWLPFGWNIQILFLGMEEYLVTRSGHKYARVSTNKEIKNTTKTWATLPVLIIQQIAAHLIRNDPDNDFVDIENQLSINRHWRHSVKNPVHRTNLTLGTPFPFYKPKINETLRFLKTFSSLGLRQLKVLKIHNLPIKKV